MWTRAGTLVSTLIVGIGLGMLLVVTIGITQAQEPWQPGRGYLGEAPGSRYGNTISIWEPEPGVHCYTINGSSIYCIERKGP